MWTYYNIFCFELFGSNLEGGTMDFTKCLCRGVLLQNAVRITKTIRSCTGILPTSGNRLSSQIAAELILLLPHGVWWCVNICELWVPSYPTCYKNQRPTPLTNATNAAKMQLQNVIQLQNASELFQSYRNIALHLELTKCPTNSMEFPFPIIKIMVHYKMLGTRDMIYYKTIVPGAFVQDPGSRIL